MSRHQRFYKSDEFAKIFRNSKAIMLDLSKRQGSSNEELAKEFRRLIVPQCLTEYGMRQLKRQRKAAYNKHVSKGI